jgi:transcriptional regulator with XRE-family HTH domain
MSNTLNKINQIASKEPSKWLDDARARRENSSWSDKSAKIAIRILREIRAQKPINGMSQKMLAHQMGVSAQYINKVVKGQENLTLETISNIEEVLGILLIEIPSVTTSQIITEYPLHNSFKIDRNNTIAIGTEKISIDALLETYFSEQEPEYTPNGTYGY